MSSCALVVRLTLCTALSVIVLSWAAAPAHAEATASQSDSKRIAGSLLAQVDEVYGAGVGGGALSGVLAEVFRFVDGAGLEVGLVSAELVPAGPPSKGAPSRFVQVRNGLGECLVLELDRDLRLVGVRPLLPALFVPAGPSRLARRERGAAPEVRRLHELVERFRADATPAGRLAALEAFGVAAGSDEVRAAVSEFGAWAADRDALPVISAATEHDRTEIRLGASRYVYRRDAARRQVVEFGRPSERAPSSTSSAATVLRTTFEAFVASDRTKLATVSISAFAGGETPLEAAAVEAMFAALEKASVKAAYIPPAADAETLASFLLRRSFLSLFDAFHGTSNVVLHFVAVAGSPRLVGMTVSEADTTERVRIGGR